MLAVVLESFVGSNYADRPDSYEFPPQYLDQFAPLSRGEPMVAVIYEPRGDQNVGRMAFVGWALLREPPQPSGRRNNRGQTLHRVRYDDRYRDFDRFVAREATGEPVETWLRALPRGRERNVATVGRAVRPLLDEDLQLIMSLGFPSGMERAIQNPEVDHRIGDVGAPEERSRRIVSALAREARFRDDVLSAYSHRCSVSGLSVGPAPSRAYGFLDAAHIQPVANRGIDAVSNGIALTPTLHRLFDRGLYTIEYRGAALVVRTSPQLQDQMIIGKEGFALRIRDGHEVDVPTEETLRPSPEQLEFHQAQVFLRH